MLRLFPALIVASSCDRSYHLKSVGVVPIRRRLLWFRAGGELSQKRSRRKGLAEKVSHKQVARYQLRRERISTVDDVAVQLSKEGLADAKIVSRAAGLLDQRLDLLPCYQRYTNLLPARHRFVITTLGRCGATEARVSGASEPVQRCIQDAFAQLVLAPNDISEGFMAAQEVRISGVVTVRMAWRP